MVNISTDKRLELLFGLQYCLWRDGLLQDDYLQETNKQYCDDFYNLYKKYARPELIEYIKNGGFDTFGRVCKLAYSLDENYNIKDNEASKEVEQRNPNYNRELMSKYLQVFVKESNYDGFIEDHKEYFDAIQNLFEEKLNYMVKYDERMITDFYGYKMDMSVKVFNFAKGSFGVSFEDKSIYTASVRPPRNDKEVVLIGNGVIGTLFHEFSHPYCNPLGYKYFSDKDFTNLFNESKQNGLESCYNNGVTIINEYMVRAVQVFLSNKYLPKEKYSIDYDIERHKGKGFIHIKEVVDKLSLNENYNSFDEFYEAEMVPFFTNLINKRVR